MSSEEIAPQGIESFAGKAVRAGVPLTSAIKILEREYFCAALNASGGNKAEAARLVGMTYQTFMRKLAVLDLKMRYAPR